MNTNNEDENKNSDDNNDKDKHIDKDNHNNDKDQNPDNNIHLNVDNDDDDDMDVDRDMDRERDRERNGDKNNDIEAKKIDINIAKNVDDNITDMNPTVKGKDDLVDLDLMDVKQTKKLPNTANASTTNGSLEDSLTTNTTIIKTTFNDKKNNKNFRDKDYEALEKSSLEATTITTTSSVRNETTLRKIQPQTQTEILQTSSQSQYKDKETTTTTKTTTTNNINSFNNSSHNRNNSSNSISTEAITAAIQQPHTLCNNNSALNSAACLEGKPNSSRANSGSNNRNSSSSSSSISNNNSVGVCGNVNSKDLSVENNIDCVSMKMTNACSKIIKLNLTAKECGKITTDSLENTNNLTDNNNSERQTLQCTIFDRHECENVAENECEAKKYNFSDDTHTLLQKLSINNPFYPYILRKQTSNSLKELRRLKRRKRFLRRIKSETDLTLLSKHLIAGTEQVVVVLDSKSLVYKPNSYLSKQTADQYQSTISQRPNESTVITNPFSIFHDDDTLNINTYLRAGSVGATTLQRPIKKHRSERSLKRLYELEQQKRSQLKTQEQSISTTSTGASYYYGGLPISRFERQDFTDQNSTATTKELKMCTKKSKTVFKHFSLRKLQLRDKNEQLDALPPQLKRLKISYPNRTQSINSLRRAYDSTTHVTNKSTLQSSIVLARKDSVCGGATKTTPNYFERLQAKTRQGIQKIRDKCRNFRGSSVYSDGSDGTFNPLAKDDSFRFISDRTHISNYESHARAFNSAGKHATIYKSYKSELDLTRNLQYLDAYLEENFDQGLQEQKKSAHSVGRVSGERLARERERVRYLERLQANPVDLYNETPKYAQPNRTKATKSHKRSASALADAKAKSNYENLGTLPMTTQHTHVHSDSLSSSDYASVFSGPTALPKSTAGVTNTAFTLGDEPPVSLRYEHPKMSEYFMEGLPASYALELSDPEAAESLLRASHESDSDFFYRDHLGDESIRILINDAEDDATTLTTNVDWYQQKMGDSQEPQLPLPRRERNFRAHSYNENLAESDFYRSLNQHLQEQEEHLMEQQHQHQQIQHYRVNDFEDFSVKGKYESYLAHFERHKTDTQAIDCDSAKNFLRYNDAEVDDNDDEDGDGDGERDGDIDDDDDDVVDGDKSRVFGNNFDYHQTQIDVTTPSSSQYARSPYNDSSLSESEKLQVGQYYLQHSRKQQRKKKVWSQSMLMTTSEGGNISTSSTIYDGKERIIGNLSSPTNVASNHKGSRYISDVISGDDDEDDGVIGVGCGVSNVGGIADGFMVYATENNEMLLNSSTTSASMLHTPASVTLYSSKSPSNRYKYHHQQQQQQQQKHYQQQQQRQKYQNPPANSINSSSLSTSSSSTSSMSQTNQSKLQQTTTGSKQCKYTTQQQQYQQKQQHYSVRRNSSASNASSTENFDNFIALRGNVNNDSNAISTSALTRSTMLGTGKSFVDYKNPTTALKQRTNMYDYKQLQQHAPTYQRQQQLQQLQQPSQHLLTSPTSTGTPLTTALNYYGNYAGSPGGIGVGSVTDSLYTVSSSTNSGSSTATSSSSTSSSSRHGTTTAIGMLTVPTACGTTNSKLSITPAKVTKTVVPLETTQTQNTAANHSNALQTILSQGNLQKTNVTAATPLLPAVMTPLQKQQHQPPLSSMQFSVTGGSSAGMSARNSIGNGVNVDTDGSSNATDFILEYEC